MFICQVKPHQRAPNQEDKSWAEKAEIFIILDGKTTLTIDEISFILPAFRYYTKITVFIQKKDKHVFKTMAS